MTAEIFFSECSGEPTVASLLFAFVEGMLLFSVT